MDKNSLYIVTGATGGIGKAIAQTLASKGYPLVLACRNVVAAEMLAAELMLSTGNEDITVLGLDLGSFSGVRQFVAELRQLNRPVAALMNIAGVMSRDSQITADGYEQTVQVNYLSTVLLSELVAPMVKPGGRIIFTTSLTRYVSRIPKCFPNEEHFSQLGTYGRSKLALTLYAQYLAEKLKDKGILVACADPGIVNTNMITMGRWFDHLADILFRPFISSPAEGAQPALNALSAADTSLLYHGKSVTRLSSALRRKKSYERLCDVTLSIIGGEKE